MGLLRAVGNGSAVPPSESREPCWGWRCLGAVSLHKHKGLSAHVPLAAGEGGTELWAVVFQKKPEPHALSLHLAVTSPSVCPPSAFWHQKCSRVSLHGGI